jgi:hypothetical protein
MIFLFLLSSVAWADSGLEFQAYPAGVQLDGVWTGPIGAQQELLTYAGYNFARRWDWGVHADEQGGGPGAGLGWRGYLKGLTGFNASVRTELWFLDIAWRDQNSSTGLTEVEVLQPSVELGWRGPGGILGRPELGLSLGQEINVVTSGQAVGQGTILRVRLGWIFWEWKVVVKQQLAHLGHRVKRELPTLALT